MLSVQVRNLLVFPALKLRREGEIERSCPLASNISCPALLENAVQIALNYLERASEIDDYPKTCQFFLINVELMMRQGQYNKIVLANRAISAFEKHHNARTIESSPVAG